MPHGCHQGLRRSLGPGQPPREQLECGCLTGQPSGHMSRQSGWGHPFRRTQCWEGPEEVRPAAVPGRGGAGLCHGRLKEKVVQEGKKPTAPGIPM